MGYGLVYYHELLELARHVNDGPGPQEERDRIVRELLKRARMTPYPGRHVIHGLIDLDAHGRPVADVDPETSKFGELDRPDCIYWTLPLTVALEYVEHLLAAGAIGRGEAAKRAHTNSKTLNATLKRMRTCVTTMPLNEASTLAAVATGNGRVSGIRKLLDAAARWHAHGRPNWIGSKS